MTEKYSQQGALAKDFFYQPFSVFDTRQGQWQSRKKQWLATGLKGELGRAKVLKSLDNAYKSKLRQNRGRDIKTMPAWASTSIFDPVLTEITYRWFCPSGGKILDAFAGGAVRGVVASMLDYHYLGLDVRQEQITANQEQAKTLLTSKKPQPKWVAHDSCRGSLYQLCRKPVDFLFTCPPYGNLEVYSDDPNDISTMPFDMFAGALTHSIKEQCKRLKPNRFAAYVVSDIRDQSGHYRSLPNIVAQAFIAGGLKLYSEVILVNVLATLPIRVRASFTKTRKIGRTHQVMLVFIKGDARLAASDIGKVPCHDPLKCN